jgi:release factor glutamine methyltransferase
MILINNDGLQYALIMTYWQPSIYELNQLLKYGLSEEDFAKAQPMPVEYFTGRLTFAGVELAIDQRALIPRVETEELVELAVEVVAAAARPPHILEIATGSGAIMTALLHQAKRRQLPVADWLVTDISAAALQLAEQNLTQVWPAAELTTHLQHSDLLGEVETRQFDLIIANLPYLPTATLATLAASVRDYEPLLALDGGVDGFVLIGRLLRQIVDGDFLQNNGQILLEVDQSHDLEFLRVSYPWVLEQFRVQAVTDQFERQRFLRLQFLPLIK